MRKKIMIFKKKTFFIKREGVCMKKILIIRFSSFGDVLLTTPVIRAIKKKYPDTIIDFIVYTNFSEAINLNPNLRKVILFEKSKSKDRTYIRNIIERLKSEKYDYVIDLHSKILSRIIGHKLKNKNTKYCRYKKRKWWKTLLVKAKLITYNADCTIVESYFTALKELGIIFSEENKKNGRGDALEFYIERNMENEIVKKYDLRKSDYFVLAPGASKFTKKWPYYDELAKKILESEKNLKIFVIGGKEDANVVKSDKNDRIVDLCGKISFKESGVLLKYSKIAVTNDSGPFHIARAVKAKTFVFFGPTDPKLFSFEKNTFLLNNPNCTPHSLYGDDKFPKKYKDCMSGISVEEVFEKIMAEYKKS